MQKCSTLASGGEERNQLMVPQSARVFVSFPPNRRGSLKSFQMEPMARVPSGDQCHVTCSKQESEDEEVPAAKQLHFLLLGNALKGMNPSARHNVSSMKLANSLGAP
jgi:hypothetical protein